MQVAKGDLRVGRSMQSEEGAQLEILLARVGEGDVVVEAYRRGDT